MSLHTFTPIPVVPPRDNIFYRLGYTRGVTELSDEQYTTINGYIDEAIGLIELCGVSRRLDIRTREADSILCEAGVVFTSRSVAELLAHAEGVLVLGATAGTKIIEAIQDTSHNDDVTRAVVFDAVASEMVDESLSWIMAYVSAELRRENKKLSSRRFSCGYGDFPLANQKMLFDVLSLSDLGITLTETCVLIPEKTVTAIAGIETIM